MKTVAVRLTAILAVVGVGVARGEVHFLFRNRRKQEPDICVSSILYTWIRH